MEFKPGDVVRLRGGIKGPTMLVSRCRDGNGGAEPIGIELIWTVQGSLQFAFLSEALLELAPPDDHPPRA